MSVTAPDDLEPGDFVQIVNAGRSYADVRARPYLVTAIELPSICLMGVFEVRGMIADSAFIRLRKLSDEFVSEACFATLSRFGGKTRDDFTEGLFALSAATRGNYRRKKEEH